ncbi:MAG: hypothetical protein JSW46_06800 [Gemmatimonadota bacterium]|nr:MAG: hypothetical protein JSW46_06800 [Gemmatimonadota bacterium]
MGHERTFGAARLAVLYGLALALPGAAAAQDPEPAARPPEVQEADSAAADTTPAPAFPLFPDPASQTPGVAQAWEMIDLLSTGALSFADLFEFTPFLDPLRAGFLEGPQAAIFAGGGGGSFAYTLDGYEIVPLTSAALDLHLIPLVELQRLTLVREPGGYRAYSQTYRNPRREPYSRIEAGNGDRETNLLRGFLSSGIGRARVAFGYDRVDTDGFIDNGDSDRDVVFANLAYPLPWGVWGQLEVRSMSADRDLFPNPKRTDWILRLRRPIGDSWHTDLVAGHASANYSAGDTLREFAASQVAIRAAYTSSIWRTQLTLRAWNGDRVPTFEPEASFELRAGPAMLYASGRYEEWDDFRAASGYAGLELDLPLNVRLLAEVEEGDRGLFGESRRRRYQFTRWTAGGELRLWSWTVGARGGSWRTEPSPALGPPADSAAALPGGTVGVIEAWARGRLFRLFGGEVSVGGWYRNREAGDFYYWPQESFRGDALYYVLALQDQLEIWLKVLGGRRGATRVPDPDLNEGWVTTAPEDWFRAEAVVRIKDFFIFYNYEYFIAADDFAEDIPELSLPNTRIHFGVKWEFWN